MLNYNEITTKKIIEMGGEPYEVLASQVSRKQQRKPVNQTKLKNLITGKVVEQAFHQSEKAEEAEIETSNFKYLYNNKGEFWFSEENDPSKRFSLSGDLIPDNFKFIKENGVVETIRFNNEIIGFKIPIKMSLKVVEAPPAIKGNTASGGDKKVVLETGAIVTAPLFINEGDTIEINTETESYSGRI